MTYNKITPSITVNYSANGNSTKSNEFGMRVMQERAYEKRGEQYLLIKSPPASGKSRALMFIALDKIHNQGIKKAIICVPEKTIGSSFNNEPLKTFGFFCDWTVKPKWNLCNASGVDTGKVDAFSEFLKSDDNILICTHATFRFALDKLGIDVLDDCLIAIDEFHHVSVNSDNRLGKHLINILERDKCHIIAMTGSYFRGDSIPIMTTEDEAKFETVTYTYYEQLNGYENLKTLNIGHYFYTGSYLNQIGDVLNPDEKTIIHIPNVNSRESTGDKYTEVEKIMEALGEFQETDDDTGFQMVKTSSGKILRIADLVDDGSDREKKVSVALKDSSQKNNRDHVDVIIALGMAKEGFDWIWCQHALTVGYRSSLTEVIQIIGRATRDAQGKTTAKFTNFIAEPDASEERINEAINDTLKAIAASLLMEQVLTPKFNFTIKRDDSTAVVGYDYGEEGYDKNKINVGVDEKNGQFHIEINGLKEPKSDEARRVCNEDLNELITSFVQDKTTLERGVFDEEIVAEELTQIKMGEIIKAKYPEVDSEDQESIRQHAIAALNLTIKGHEKINNSDGANTALIDGIRAYTLDVRNLDIDLIDKINPFGEAYAILAKSMNEKTLENIKDIITVRRAKLSHEEAKLLAMRALDFLKEHGKLPNTRSQDPWEQKMAEGVLALKGYATEDEKND